MHEVLEVARRLSADPQARLVDAVAFTSLPSNRAVLGYYLRWAVAEFGNSSELSTATQALRGAAAAARSLLPGLAWARERQQQAAVRAVAARVRYWPGGAASTRTTARTATARARTSTAYDGIPEVV